MKNKQHDFWEWMDLKWFSKETMDGFDWDTPFWLNKWLIGGIVFAVLLRYLIVYFLHKKQLINKSPKSFSFDISVILGLIPQVLLGISIYLIFLALAGPHKTEETTEEHIEGRDIMLVLDISGSMISALDFDPNRLEAAKDVAKQFVEERKGDRIGLVVYAKEQYCKAPLTTDHKFVAEQIESITKEDLDINGTTIGDALMLATNRIIDSDAKSKIIVLLSDGNDQGSKTTPKAAAEYAYVYGIKVYTIGIGKKGMINYLTQDGRIFSQQSDFDEEQLKQISKIGGGKHYLAQNKTALKNIFSEINKLEKSKILEEHFKQTTEYFHIYLTWAIAFLLAWMLTKFTFLTNATVD